MNEGFDLNRKSAPGEGYRKNLADKLRGMKDEDAQNELVNEQNKEAQYTNEYKEEKIEQRAQWIISKYLSESDLFKLEESFSLKERQAKIDEILNQKIGEIKEKGGVSDEYEEDVYKLVSRIIKENDFERNPNLKHFKREHSDIILQKEGKNKFIVINLRDNNLDEVLNTVMLNSNNGSFAKSENVILGVMKRLSNKCLDEKSKIKYFTEMIFRGTLSHNLIIARPMTDNIFNQHYQLNNKFKREHKDYTEDKRGWQGYEIKDSSLIFGEDKKEKMDTFIKGFIEIIENETDYDVAMEKIINLPKPAGLKPTYSVIGGGYMSMIDNKLNLNGNSEVYGSALSNRENNIKLRNILMYEDFTKEEINSRCFL